MESYDSGAHFPQDNMPWDLAIDMHTEVQKMEAAEITVTNDTNQYLGYANQYYKFEIYFDVWALMRPLLPAPVPIQRHSNCHGKWWCFMFLLPKKYVHFESGQYCLTQK